MCITYYIIVVLEKSFKHFQYTSISLTVNLSLGPSIGPDVTILITFNLHFLRMPA